MSARDRSQLLLLVLLPLIASACGRGSVEGLTLTAANRDGGPAESPSDGPGFPSDGPKFGTDGPVGSDGPVIHEGGTPDIGDGPQCRSGRDCFALFGGPPMCPDGVGVWGCREGACVPECTMRRCANDCECPFSEACIRGECTVSSRINQCCANPSCTPGDFCVQPNGQPSLCGGPRPDAGPLPDSGLNDGGLRDGGGRDGAVPPDTGPLPDDTPVGAQCFGANDACGSSGFCIDESNGFPGGYCSQECGPNGQSCPVGSVCRGVGGGNAICLDACASSSECRTGYNCIQLGLGAQRVCWPIPPSSTNPTGTPVGSACGGDNDCASGLQCLDFGGGWPDGYCTLQYCDPQTNPCPGGSLCYAFPGLFSLCLDDCPSAGSRSTCRQGYYCLGPTGQPGVCVSN